MYRYLYIKNFNKNIQEIINKNTINRILLAISGGQDSLCLVKSIERFKNKHFSININKHIQTEYIYVDHQWKESSKQQIEHIINYLSSINEAISIYQIKNVTTSENECRIHRYNILIQHAVKHKQSIIITAHTKTDKIETFFQNIFRGTGIEGTTSLNLQRQLKQGIHLLRPLIEITRENVSWICRQFFLPIWSDTSNYNYQIQRNRIRYELMPYLKKYFNEKIENRINYLLKTCYYENEYIKQNIIKLYLNSTHKQYIALNRNKIIQQSFIIQLRIIKFFLFHSIYYNIQTQKIIEIMQIIKNCSKNSYINFKNYRLHITRNWIYIAIKANKN